MRQLIKREIILEMIEAVTLVPKMRPRTEREKKVQQRGKCERKENEKSCLSEGGFRAN